MSKKFKIKGLFFKLLFRRKKIKKAIEETMDVFEKVKQIINEIRDPKLRREITEAYDAIKAVVE